MPLRIGLTGGIGSGKTTVSELFRQLNIPIIDADEIARQLVEPGQPGYAEVVRTFGSGILTPAGELDRARMRQQIFSDPEKKRALEAILHPLVYRAIKQACTGIEAPYVLIVVPLLLETGGERHVDRVLVVDAGEEQQIMRAQARDNTAADEIRSIMASQLDRQSRLARADDIIRNDCSLEQLQSRVDKLHTAYLELARAAGA